MVPPCKWPEPKNHGFRWGYKLQTPISGGFGFPTIGFLGFEKNRRVLKGWLRLLGHLSNEKTPGCLGYVGDYTSLVYVYRDCNKPL